MAKIGFIGTGIMGLPMAQNLQKAGHSLFVSTHHDAAPAALLEAGAIALANPKEVAQEAMGDGWVVEKINGSVTKQEEAEDYVKRLLRQAKKMDFPLN